MMLCVWSTSVVWAIAQHDQDANKGAVRTELLRDAERALAVGPFSVMQKTRVPPSGDKHDFLTLAPYWWPDPTKMPACPTSAATAR